MVLANPVTYRPTTPHTHEDVKGNLFHLKASLVNTYCLTDQHILPT